MKNDHLTENNDYVPKIIDFLPDFKGFSSFNPTEQEEIAKKLNLPANEVKSWFLKRRMQLHRVKAGNVYSLEFYEWIRYFLFVLGGISFLPLSWLPKMTLNLEPSFCMIKGIDQKKTNHFLSQKTKFSGRGSISQENWCL